MQTLLAAGWRGALHGGARRIERRGAVRSATRVRGRVSSGVVPIIPPEPRVCWLAGWLVGWRAMPGTLSHAYPSGMLHCVRYIIALFN